MESLNILVEPSSTSYWQASTTKKTLGKIVNLVFLKTEGFSAVGAGQGHDGRQAG